MSSTRRATDGVFHQERFASSPEFENGLRAYDVAKRCELLASPEDTRLIWSLQLLSHRQGMRSLAAELLQRFGSRIPLPQVRQLARVLARVTDKDRLVWAKARLNEALAEHALPSEIEVLSEEVARWNYLSAEPTMAEPQAAKPPRASAAERVDALSRQLAELCLDPACHLDLFPDLVACLRQFIPEWISLQRKTFVETEITHQTHDALSYALRTGSLVVVDGPPAKIGKSVAAETFCDQHPGQVRYVRVPSSSDDITFFRAVAKSIGSASALSIKGVELRERAEAVLQRSKLMLVLDDAHCCWPQRNRRESLPNRLNWILASLVQRGVPVALIITDQFLTDARLISQKTGWNERQFIEQVGQYWRLPRRLSDADLRAIARHNYPEGDEAMIEALAACASASDRFLSALLGAIKEVRYVAQNAGRTKPTMADVKKAAISQMQTAAHLAAAFGDRPLRQSEAAGPAPAPEKRIEIPTGRGILPVEATTTAN